jgi:hypothetical protein
MTKQEILDKVKKLYRLAGSNFAAEAESAMLKAQELMAQYGVSAAEVSKEAREEKTVERAEAENGKRTMPTWQSILCTVIARNFRCEVYINGATRNPVFLGLSQDANAAKETFVFAVNAAETLWQQYRHEAGLVGLGKAYVTGCRNDYMDGFVAGMKRKFTENVTERGLIIVKDQLVTEAFSKMHLRSATRYKGSTSGNAGSYRQGERDGYSSRRGKYIS